MGTTHGVDSSDSSMARKPYKSVFERLVSPSQATGTQRQKLARKNPYEEGNSPDETESHNDDDLERMLDDALGESTTGSQLSEGGEEHYTAANSLRSYSDTMESPISKDKRITGRDYSGYAEQDVFERLQTISTASYQNRQGEAVRHGSYNSESFQGEHGVLQSKTSTSSDAQTNIHDEFYNNDDDQHTPYTQLDVFERLQRTTTEAYAKKVQRQTDGH